MNHVFLTLAFLALGYAIYWAWRTMDLDTKNLYYYATCKYVNRRSAMTVGEDRVRVKFNPSGEGLVEQIKQKSAELIDICEELKAKDVRLASLAQTHYEDAAMWAVKAATA